MGRYPLGETGQVKMKKPARFSQKETMEKDLMTVVFERCCGLDIHKILPNRNHLPLMISQCPCVLMLFRHRSTV